MRHVVPIRALALALAASALLALAPPPVPLAAQDDCVTIDDFAKAKVGTFPARWEVHKHAGKHVYTVREEGGLRFLRAVSKGLGIQAARRFSHWNLETYPVLAWSWRPREFPKHADERDPGRNDSVLAVYMFVPYSYIRGPKALKYIWSASVPTGTTLTSNHGLTQVVVLESGTGGADSWHDERVNVLEDSKRRFGISEAPKPAGIGVLTDADDTGSFAAGDYANFRACRA